MDADELIELLNNRSGAWLGRKLDFQQPRQSVYQWTSGRLPIPEKYHIEIREICA